MKKHDLSCEDISIKIMALIDGELAQNEIEYIKSHLAKCKQCKEKYNSLTKIKEKVQEMKFKKLPEMYWDEYWQHVYNKIERGISWILISIGAIILLSYALWNMIKDTIADQELNIITKFAIFFLLIGGVILLISIIREKLMVRKVDKYRKVER